MVGIHTGVLLNECNISACQAVLIVFLLIACYSILSFCYILLHLGLYLCIHITLLMFGLNILNSCALLIIWIFLVDNYHLGWNSPLIAALLCMYIVCSVIMHVAAAC